MSCQGWEERLNERVDDLLDAAEAAAVDRHAASCAGCGRELEELHALRRAAAGLPREVEPSRDLWPEIRERLEPAAGAARGLPSRWLLGLAAAAILVVGFAAGLMLRPAPEPDPSILLASYQEAEAEYRRITRDLQGRMAARRDDLSPETLAIVEENLRIIDEAIQEVRTALEKDPANVGNGRRFTHLYGRKVALLQQAVAMPAES